MFGSARQQWRAATPGRRSARDGRADRPCHASAARTVRRRASARRHRAQHHQQSEAHPRRRADRQSRQRQRLGDLGSPVRFAARARSDSGHGVSRAGSGQALRAADQHEGRQGDAGPADGAGRTRRSCESSRNLPSAICNAGGRDPFSRYLAWPFAVGSFITLYGLSRSVHENVQRSFEEHGTDLTVKRRGIAEPFGGTIPESHDPGDRQEFPASPPSPASSSPLPPPITTTTCSPSGWAPGRLLLGQCAFEGGARSQSGRTQGCAGRERYRADPGQNVGRRHHASRREVPDRRHHQLPLDHQPQRGHR